MVQVIRKTAPVLKSWFAYAAAISLVCVIIYITVQQGYRQSANDPQFALAEDAANAISKGIDPKTVIGSTPVIELSQTLSPFLAIYGTDGGLAASNATLDGRALKVPRGLLDNARFNGMTAVTWQPRSGIRQATVSLHAKGYIVVAGRSLRITEERISMLGRQVAFGWLLSMVGMAVVLYVQSAISSKPELA
ncbi:hypothetical protein [Mucilaginibacter sp.]|jgi:hypothetical protein|uniref:hypothetical protein n=1 Tax=Mucilaginibacter sp. TaxID=1882438 RepID=UPI002B683CA7|nr:hypothetical protein [Mucilaginibacter sp.]HTI58476.1 hypothetical protein [Mucilaginibacter sp.]